MSSDLPRLLLFNKPFGVLSQFTDEGAHPGLGGHLDVPDVYAAGRLDRDSEGPLLLTDDGRLQHRIAHPRFGHPKTYWAQVERIPGEAALHRLAGGVEISDGPTLPCRVRRIEEPPALWPRDPPIRYRKTVPTAWLEIVLREGRNRQVRRMTAAVGHPTLRLVRWSVAHLTLAGLGPGDWRWARPGEVDPLLARPGRHRQR